MTTAELRTRVHERLHDSAETRYDNSEIDRALADELRQICLMPIPQEFALQMSAKSAALDITDSTFAIPTASLRVTSAQIGPFAVSAILGPDARLNPFDNVSGATRGSPIIRVSGGKAEIRPKGAHPSSLKAYVHYIVDPPDPQLCPNALVDAMVYGAVNRVATDKQEYEIAKTSRDAQGTALKAAGITA